MRLFVEKGYLTGLKIFGDFFGKEPLENLYNMFISKDSRETVNALTELVKTYKNLGFTRGEV